MSGLDSTDVAGLLDGLFRQDSRRILATLIRLLGDFDLAEDGLHDAFAAALHSWPREGIPSNPRAWLVSTGRFKAIDRLRRQARFAPLEDLPSPPSMDLADLEDQDGAELEDDRLRPISRVFPAHERVEEAGTSVFFRPNNRRNIF